MFSISFGILKVFSLITFSINSTINFDLNTIHKFNNWEYLNSGTLIDGNSISISSFLAIIALKMPKNTTRFPATRPCPLTE